jgi:hypothetical protein
MRRDRWTALLALAALGAPAAARAADAPALPTVTYNVGLRAFENVLPHRTPFLIQMTVGGADADYDTVEGWAWPSDGGPCDKRPTTAHHLAGTAADKDDGGQRKLLLDAPRLHYATRYCFSFQLRRGWSKDDRAAAAAAAQAALSAAETKGSYTRTSIRASLEKALGARAQLPVALTGAKAEGPSTLLIDLLASRMTVAALKPLFDAQRAYHNQIESVRQATRALIAQGLEPPKTLGDALPTDVTDTNAAYKAAVEAAQTLPALSADLSTADVDAARAERPAPPGDDEKKYGARLDLLAEDAGRLQARRCAPPGPPALKSYCDAVASAAAAAKGIRADLARAGERATAFADTEAALLDAVKTAVAALTVQLPPAAPMATDTPGYTERSAFYMSADVGGMLPIFRLHGGDVGVASFIGVAIYFTAVDKDVPLAEEDGPGKRMSLTIGGTINDVRDATGSAKGALGGKGLMVGAGLRATDYLRLGAGAVLVTQSDANPVSTTTHLRLAPYLSLSIDVDVAGTIQSSISKYKGN